MLIDEEHNIADSSSVFQAVDDCHSWQPGLTNRLVGFSSAADHGQALNGCCTDHRQQSQQLRSNKLLRGSLMQVRAVAFEANVVFGEGA